MQTGNLYSEASNYSFEKMAPKNKLQVDKKEGSEANDAVQKLFRHSKKISKANSNQFKEEGKKSRKTWTSQEDKWLVFLINKYGQRWSFISQKMGNSRTGKQIRERYLNNLDPAIKTSQWEKHEDEQLLRLFKLYGRKWSKIARQIPGRRETAVKNRFFSLFKDQTQNICPDENNLCAEEAKEFDFICYQTDSLKSFMEIDMGDIFDIQQDKLMGNTQNQEFLMISSSQKIETANCAEDMLKYPSPEHPSTCRNDFEIFRRGMNACSNSFQEEEPIASNGFSIIQDNCFTDLEFGSKNDSQLPDDAITDTEALASGSLANWNQEAFEDSQRPWISNKEEQMRLLRYRFAWASQIMMESMGAIEELSEN